MAAIDRGLETLNFLPDGVREALRRRLRELGGFGLIVLATLLALALATWSVQDPSLSHATNAPVRNLLGAPGAIVADLLMQVLGVAALAFILPIAMWGWRLITHRPLRHERLRLLFWVLGVVLSAGCAAALPRSPAWPLPVGLGGVIGDWVLRLPALLAGGTLAGAMRVSRAHSRAGRRHPHRCTARRRRMAVSNRASMQVTPRSRNSLWRWRTRMTTRAALRRASPEQPRARHEGRAAAMCCPRSNSLLRRRPSDARR